MNYHGKQMPVRIDFASHDDEEEEEEEKKGAENVEMSRETYKDNFPTLSQTSKVMRQGLPREPDNTPLWPSLPSSHANHRVQTAKPGKK
jgi:hypothetical protein